MADHPETLAKYCSAKTALAILGSRRLRWSAPHLFGDPFELDHQSRLGFDPHSLLDAVIKAATSMIFSREPPKGNSPLATVVRRWRDEERFDSQEEAEEVLKELLARMVDQRQETIDNLMADWRRFTRQLRIACFSAKPDNLLCWQRYGDNHRGAVIRFRCGGYTNLPSPQAVNYRSNRPEITTLRDQLNGLIYNERLNTQQEFPEKFLAKSSVVGAEQEWRCFYQAENEMSSRENNQDLWFDDRAFERSDVSAVYLGVYMPTEEKKQLFELLRSEYSQTRVFQAQVAPGKYDIEFNRILNQD